ncbi:glycosyl transferase [Allorhizobium sp. BGMRC 0089]|uniref:O-linked N-acetylglucosamine transferase, SPINDLY family protein n=1 Tax=Allorhizobium sonneratiae TaxID=2934936 RepID=UPI00203382AB|nr:glycosyl transferase [Allorhizobium sonneratiae]MCM2293732.1 glycosyl transferase [Allorhizobium sonneratiae]
MPMPSAMERAMQLYQAQDFASARILLEAERDRAALPLPGLLILAQCQARLGDNASAATLYRIAADAMEGVPDKIALLSLALTLLRTAGRFDEAHDVARLLLGLDPRHQEAAYVFRHTLRQRLDIEEQRSSNAAILAGMRRNDPFYFGIESPLNHIAWCADEALNSRVTFVEGAAAFTPEDRHRRRHRPHVYSQRPRVGYLSSDFSDCHATMQLLQGVLDFHDPQAIDFTLFCHTSPAMIAADGDFRKRHAERIVPLGHLDTETACAAIRARQIDILVDLKGHTLDGRLDIVNRGPAPIQVAYLGFPGSQTGVDCDYIVTDAIVTPPESRPWYHEKFCLLPDCYQPNDNLRRSLPPPLSRKALGLPEGRFIFAAMNAIRKITPDCFDLWMEILRRTGDSVLWMLSGGALADDHFRRAVAAAGIDPARVIFAAKTGYLDHLARLPAADLGLDSFPYNGHTTTSEQLWVGLPLVTKRGTHFASRVSESLLHAIDLPEMVADNDAAFVDLAVRLSQEPETLAALRQKLIKNRRIAPLFDTERYTRHLEKAFVMMIERARQGLEPDHFAVPPLPPRSSPFAIGPSSLGCGASYAPVRPD